MDKRIYLFKVEKKKELLEGRKIKNIAEQVGITKCFLSSVLGRKRPCSKLVAYCITKSLNKELEIDDCFDRIR